MKLFIILVLISTLSSSFSLGQNTENSSDFSVLNCYKISNLELLSFVKEYRKHLKDKKEVCVIIFEKKDNYVVTYIGSLFRLSDIQKNIPISINATEFDVPVLLYESSLKAFITQDSCYFERIKLMLKDIILNGTAKPKPNVISIVSYDPEQWMLTFQEGKLIYKDRMDGKELPAWKY